MASYIAKRILLLVFTLWGVTAISFAIIQLAPGSPLEMKLRADPGGGLGDQSGLSQEAREQLKKLYHLDRPLFERYLLWLGDIVRLDFGKSFSDHRPVLDKISERLPVSITFGISAILVALLIGIPLGLLASAKQGTWIDRGISFFTVSLYAMPTYVLGILLLTFLGGGEFLDWFPIYGIQSDDYDRLDFWSKVGDRLHHFILPGLCYCIGSLAFITEQQRASMLEALHQDYIRTARAKGLSETVVYWKHAFRNALIPIVTIMGGMIPAILGGGVIIESLFSVPGLGLLSYQAILERDYPVIMANFTITGFLTLLGLFFSDILYVLVDPRIDFEDLNS